LRVASQQFLRRLFTEELDTGPTLDMQLDRCQSGWIGRCKRGAFDGNSVAAAIILIQLRAQKSGEVALQV